ncbi:MAG: hypothetical protein ACI4I3_02545 [Acutalibacteraceae bacterium]
MKNIVKKAIAIILSIVTVFTFFATTAFAGEEVDFRMLNRYMTLYYGNSAELIVCTNSDDVYFTSSDERVAAVDENGVVTSKGIGECVITAGVNGTDIKEECTVRVELLWWEVFGNIIYFVKNLLGV